MQVPSRLKRDGTCSFLLGISCPGYCDHSTDYRATRASGVDPPIVPLPSLTTASAPISGSPGGLAGVASPTLKVHVPPTASGVVKEQVFAGTVYKPPTLSRRFSAVICKGALPLLVTVTTLVTGARGAGIVNVKVGTPSTLPSVPLVAEVMLNLPCPPPPPPPPVVAANSIAPASTALFVFLAFPKKSKLGATL